MSTTTPTPHRESVFHCNIAEFERRYDSPDGLDRLGLNPGPQIRALRMLRMVTEAAIDLVKQGADLADIHLEVRKAAGGLEHEMHVVLIPKWKLKVPEGTTATRTRVMHIHNGITPFVEKAP